MKQAFGSTWKSSVQPRKQRKYRIHAPLHIRASFMHVHLAAPLRLKYKKRALLLRKGDKVKIVRGKFAGIEAKVERVDHKLERVFVDKAEVQKKDGSKAKVPIHPSKLILTELYLDDKKRMQKLKPT